MASFDDFLSERGKQKAKYSTPMQDVNRAGQVHAEIFGTDRGVRPVTSADWKRLDEADRQARVARNFLRDGTYDKGSDCC